MTGHAPVAGRSTKEVLAITDGAPASTNALWRAALIAREHGAELRVLHVAGERARILQMNQALDNLGRQVQARLGIDLNAEVLHGELLGKAVAAARSAQLLVIGPRRANPLREWISGTQAERLIRLCRIPTLVVKRPATPGRDASLGNTSEPGRYGRVLVSVDLRPEAADLIAAAMAFSRDPQTQVLYALAADVKRRPGAPEAAGSGTDTAMQRAQSALKDLVRSSGAQGLGVVPSVAFGQAAECVLARERAMGAELVVIGKRRRGLLADFILGGVTQKVLAGSTADVLVVPSTEHRAVENPRPAADGSYPPGGPAEAMR